MGVYVFRVLSESSTEIRIEADDPFAAEVNLKRFIADVAYQREISDYYSWSAIIERKFEK